MRSEKSIADTSRTTILSEDARADAFLPTMTRNAADSHHHKRKKLMNAKKWKADRLEVEIHANRAAMGAAGAQRAAALVCVVPGPRKARAVRATLSEPIGTQCPATVLRQHSNAVLFLNAESAAMI